MIAVPPSMRPPLLLLALASQAAAFSPSPLTAPRARPQLRPAALRPGPQPRTGAPIRPPRLGLLRATGQAKGAAPGVSASHYAWFLGVLPALSLAFPPLIDAAQNSAVPEDRRTLIILLLILKRVYIYLLAITTVDIAGRRSVGSAEGLGSRMQALNEEILDGYLPKETDEQKKESKQAYAALNTVDSGTQALLIPAALAALLASSFFFLGVQNLPPPEAVPQDAGALGQMLTSLGQAAGKYLPVISTAAVCLLFTRSEFAAAETALKRKGGVPPPGGGAPPSEGGTPPEGAQRSAALAASALAVGACYLGPTALVWPVRNVVNSCLAVTAARAFQLPSLRYVVLALGLLIGYDVFSVFGTGSLVAPAAAAAADAVGGGGGERVRDGVSRTCKARWGKLAAGAAHPGGAGQGL